LEVKNLEKRLAEMNFKLDISDDAVNYLGEQGYDEAYGARPLARSIQHYVEDAIADEILHGNIVEGELIKIGFDKNKEEITIKSVKQKSK
jgi:ATP-dependent Clp protease ATP-binding subunit ClpC